MTNTVITSDQKRNLWSVITASSVGTLIEWYDFFIFGSLATILSEQFFPKTNPTAAFLSTLATFAAGFVVRPFGALVFGRLGDKVGRKYTFLVTLVIMGGSTFAIGLVPSYETIGVMAPVIVLTLRLLQGLALGGEYGGAATYVAEHAPANKRGFYTSFIQITATLGLFVSLGVILIVRQSVGVEAFTSWGWRVPFLLSALLVGVSIYIRLRMSESPLFAKIKAEGKLANNPIKESFGKKENLMLVLIALFGATAGQGVVFYTSQFYALSYLQKICQIEYVQSNTIVAIALVIGTPLFIFFGALSDRFGRKFIMMGGLLLAALLYRPIYEKMYALADVSTKSAVESATHIEHTVSKNEKGETVDVNKRTLFFTDGTRLAEITKQVQTSNAKPEVKQEVTLTGSNHYWMVGLILIQVILVTMVYGPIAAFLVELFPTRIRYTSMSLPYHIGNGVFGGLTPFIATALATQNTDKFVGLWYPIIVAAISFVVGMIFLNNKKVAEVE
jgi:MHS family proline/betaine transporter-like MFS transporter